MKPAKRWTIHAAIFLACSSAFADNSVRGHIRKDGSYVAPHHRTDPNSTRRDNYSTQGNINPYNGQTGTKPLYETAPRYRRSKSRY